MAILCGLLFHWSVMTWFLGMDTRLRLGRERFERVMLLTKLFFGVMSAFFGAEQRFSKVCNCTFKNRNFYSPNSILAFIDNSPNVNSRASKIATFRALKYLQSLNSFDT
jgi:hypothetical protein